MLLIVYFCYKILSLYYEIVQRLVVCTTSIQCTSFDTEGESTFVANLVAKGEPLNLAKELTRVEGYFP